MVDKKRKSKRGRPRKRPETDKKLKQKQKQKQEVNVNVSSGGGGGGFIPVPQSAPTFDYSLLANLIRPAATVDVPIMAQQMAPALPTMAAVPTLEEDVYRLSKFTPEMRERIAESGAAIALEKPANIRKPVKKVPVEPESGAVTGGGIFGSGIFNRPARDKAAGRIPTEPLYEESGSVRL